MDDRGNLFKEKSFSLKQLLKIQLVNNRKRFFSSVLMGFFIVFILSSFFLTWRSYQYHYFTLYMENEHNWTQDEAISASYSTITASFEPNYSQTYLNDIIQEISSDLNSLIPSIVTNDSVTAAMTTELYYQNPNETTVQSYSFYAFDELTTNIIASNIIEGRMPKGSNEILHYQSKNNMVSYELNDTISVRAKKNSISLNFTIVGIVKNLQTAFLKTNRSIDILNWQSYIENYRYIFTGSEKFILPHNFYLEAMNTYPVQNCGRAVIIDLNYWIPKIEIQDLNEIIKDLQLLSRETTLQAEPHESFNFYGDLLSALINFQINWLQKTFQMIALIIPVIFLIFLLAIETFQLGKKQYKLDFQLLKLYGLKNNDIRKSILAEASLFSSLCLFSGLFLSFITSMPISLSLFGLSISNYSNNLLDPFLLIVSLVLFVIFFSGSFLFKNSLLNKTTLHISESNVNTKNPRKYQKLLKYKELFYFFPGLIVFVIGIQLIMSSPEAIIFGNTTTLEGMLKAIIAWSLTYVGVIFILLSIFQLLSKGLIQFLIWIGKKYWQQKKNFLTFSLKSFQLSKIIFKRFTFVVLIIGLCMIPGFLMRPSIEKHLTLETNLQTGYSNYLITSWNPDLDKEDIENITGIESSFQVTHLYIENEVETYNGKVITYSIELLAIHNLTDFLTIIDFNKNPSFTITNNDFLFLEENLTCLVNHDFAKKEGFQTGEKFDSSFFGSAKTSYNLTFINSFKLFPLLPYPKKIPFYDYYQPVKIITSFATEQLIEQDITNPYIFKDSSLLLKISPNANVSQIKKEIKNEYGLTMTSRKEVISSLWSTVNVFGLYLMVFNSAITIFVIFIFAFTSAQTIFKDRLKIIESLYRIGAKREQLWKSFTIEIVLLISIPLIISILIGIFLLPLIGKIFINQHQVYSLFKPVLKWWTIPLFYFVTYLIIMSGWFLSIIPQVKKYHLLKQK
ncbi:MAG: ABC transporter permease [Promethearchaeota archaeon]|nr:MAG: ABC transporter permease [Candidatus Lokiarchaeota archaeon]